LLKSAKIFLEKTRFFVFEFITWILKSMTFPQADPLYDQDSIIPWQFQSSSPYAAFVVRLLNIAGGFISVSSVFCHEKDTLEEKLQRKLE
jgi:hypothetical protein